MRHDYEMIYIYKSFHSGSFDTCVEKHVYRKKEPKLNDAQRKGQFFYNPACPRVFSSPRCLPLPLCACVLCVFCSYVARGVVILTCLLLSDFRLAFFAVALKKHHPQKPVRVSMNIERSIVCRHIIFCINYHT